MANCRSCGAEVVWLVNRKSGRRAPIDAAPSPEGNVEIDLPAGTYDVLSKKELGERSSVLDPRSKLPPLYLNHFVTCPQRKSWAKK